MPPDLELATANVMAMADAAHPGHSLVMCGMLGHTPDILCVYRPVPGEHAVVEILCDPGGGGCAPSHR